MNQEINEQLNGHSRCFPQVLLDSLRQAAVEAMLQDRIRSCVCSRLALSVVPGAVLTAALQARCQQLESERVWESVGEEVAAAAAGAWSAGDEGECGGGGCWSTGGEGCGRVWGRRLQEGCGEGRRDTGCEM